MGLLLLLGALQACTGIKLGYNNGVDLAAWWLDGHIDFNKAQSQQVRYDLGQLQLRHRQQDLPDYAQTLRQTQTLVAHDLSTEQVCSVANTVRGYIDALLVDAEPAATTLVQSLTPAQISYLERKYAKTNAEYRSDWLALTPTAMHQKRFDKALERAEMVYGRMDTAQKTLVRQQVEQSRFDPQQVQAERLRRQTDTLQTLRQLQRDTPTAAEARAAVHGLLERSMHSPQASYHSYAEALAQQDCQAIALVHNSTTTKQREAAVRWLAGYEQSLRELAAQR
ncbi:DUF6279 family lipoprotein [Rhodoferax sp.]|uniref:DUF6279 family lipoprotein n=1 Tax=Rhodoferax sp. TaxID=50421 RepID=UPI0025DDD988|nr:DUF6279 family lipoprotein [Rhodoferax sp.]